MIKSEKPFRFQALDSAPRATIEEERRYRKLRLAAAYRIFALKGYDFSLAGHITVRDPEFEDQFWVAPLGPWFGHVTVSDLCRVDAGGYILDGKGPINQAGFAIHSEIHKARPEIHAAAHGHSINGKAWSTLGRLLDPISQDACFFYQNHALFANFSGIVTDASEGAAIARALGGGRGAILQNHGILTVGRSVDSAVAAYIFMENACEAQLKAEAAGTPVLIDHATAVLTSMQGNESDPGAYAFPPLYARILREQPDFQD